MAWQRRRHGTRRLLATRRYQKLVGRPHRSDRLSTQDHSRPNGFAKGPCTGAGTVEYPGQSSWLDLVLGGVNTRWVEHPVTEETAGIDLVLQQFRIANGEKLNICRGSTPRGHAIGIPDQRRGRGGAASTRPVTKFHPPPGPGVRGGLSVETGSVIGGLRLDAGQADRAVPTAPGAGARPARAEQFGVEGLATVISFHRAVVSGPAFIGDANGFRYIPAGSRPVE